jgi:hypothetical protein
MAFTDWFDRFAVWQGVPPDLETLFLYAVGIVVYTFLVFAFYETISRRDPLHSKDAKGFWGTSKHVAETMLTFPIISFCYFAMLVLSLFLLSKPVTATSDIIMLSMAVVMGVRVMAHLNESLSNELAKMIPLGLLAVVIVNPGYLSVTATWSRIGELPAQVPVLVQYFVIFILAEAAMRGLRAIAPSAFGLWKKEERHRKLSKKAMLKDVAHEHGATRTHAFHEHGPRAKGEPWLDLDEGHVGKPGRNQGAGPALAREKAPHAGAGHVARAAATGAPHHARSGPGGKGGTFAKLS